MKIIKLKWLVSIGLAAIVMLILATAVMAQGSPPAPYAGMKNPFPWDDASAQSAGGTAYKQVCLGCHGVKGDGVTAFDFSKAEFSNGLQTQPDFYFWVLSEGRLSNGMPPFKTTLSEQQRWQILTYINSLPSGAAGGETPSSPGTEDLKGNVRLVLPAETESGKPLTLKATLRDDDGNPIPDATLKFFLDVDFFTSGLMEVGDAVTDANGVAAVEYTPRHAGQLKVVAGYGNNQAVSTVNVAGGVELTYHTEAGIHLPNVGPEDIVFPKSVLTLRAMDQAPLPALRLPGGVLSWLLLLVATVFMIWFTYFRVFYQVFQIPIKSEIRDINTRLIPTIGLILVTSVGLMLILKLLITPYSHLNLPLS